VQGTILNPTSGVRHWVSLILLAGMTALHGCGDSVESRGSSEGGTSEVHKNLESATAKLHKEVDTAVVAVFPGVAARVDEDATGRKACDDSATENEDYAVLVDVQAADVDAAVQRARSYWEGRGFTAREEGHGTDVPRIYTRVGDVAAALHANKGRGTISVGGSTPCF
jgi:hypothetical protein